MEHTVDATQCCQLRPGLIFLVNAMQTDATDFYFRCAYHTPNIRLRNDIFKANKHTRLHMKYRD